MDSTTHGPGAVPTHRRDGYSERTAPTLRLARGELRALEFERVERLPGNVGYVDLRGFSPVDRAALTAVAAVMDGLADTDALVLDLRRHRGGDRAMAALLSSFLFDTESAYADAEYWARGTGADAGAHVAGRRYLAQEVYVLTGLQTSADGLRFARTLQRLRGAAVVGPVPRAASTDDWVPDVPVAECVALQAAQLMALRELRARAHDDPAMVAQLTAAIGVVTHELRVRAAGVSSAA